MATWNAKHKVTWSRAIRSWRLGRVLHLSIPFTWLVAEAEKIARGHDGPVVAGGPGIQLLHPDGCEWAEVKTSTAYPTLAMHNPLACRTTRGCPNKCGFCAVPKLEGDFRELDLPRGWVPGPLFCDDNLLAASEKHLAWLVERLRMCSYPEVDFNQGLDARRFTRWHAELFASLHKAGTKPLLRFSYDHSYQEAGVLRAVELARSAGFPARRIRVFVLLGFDDSPEDARRRCEAVRAWGLKPNPMRYQPLDALERNAYVAPGWTAALLQKVCRYYARDIFRGIPFDEFQAEEPQHAQNADIQGRLFA